ncbi:hypothetical protein ALQ41_05232 [Pseudomonas savastanoi pv. glycinea]|uniref:Uncharacterized protein n=1 Tax=Pseudomonas savastanoi pv. glycinea TaxID=318 RepID=A0A3M3VBN1_PSESG|nr:hypothetical protein ALQ41_05232 [Pseudomonas savastanoi pv. glycinea]
MTGSCVSPFQSVRVGRPATPATAKPVEIQIDDRRGKQRQYLADEQTADHHQPQWLAQLCAGAAGKHQRNGAEQCCQGGHENRPETQQRRFVDRRFRCNTPVALCVEREVDHHDRVLLDDADQQNDTDDRDHPQVIAADQQGQQGTHCCRRQCREDGDRVDIALVEHAQHDVHGHYSRQNQQQRARQRCLKCLGSALKLGLHTNRHADVLLNLFDDLHGLAQCNAGRKVERHHHCGKLPEVSNGQLRLTLLDACQARQFYLCAIGGLDVDLLKCGRAEFTARRGLQHHAVLAGLGIDGGNLSLTECVVQRIGNIRNGDPYPTGRITIDVQIYL